MPRSSYGTFVRPECVEEVEFLVAAPDPRPSPVLRSALHTTLLLLICVVSLLPAVAPVAAFTGVAAAGVFYWKKLRPAAG